MAEGGGGYDVSSAWGGDDGGGGATSSHGHGHSHSQSHDDGDSECCGGHGDDGHGEGDGHGSGHGQSGGHGHGESPAGDGAVKVDDPDLPGDQCKFKGSPLEQRTSSAAQDRERGHKAYVAGDFEKATEAWSMSRGSLKYIIDQNYLKDDPEALAKVREDQYKMHLNLAQVFLKTGEYRQCLEYAGRALTYDEKSVKALYRTALAHKELSLYDECRSWLKKLEAAEPGNPLGRQLFSDVKRLEVASLKTAKKSASKIFTTMNKEEHDYRVPKSLAEKAKTGFGAVPAARSWLSTIIDAVDEFRMTTRSWCRRRRRNLASLASLTNWRKQVDEDADTSNKADDPGAEVSTDVDKAD